MGEWLTSVEMKSMVLKYHVILSVAQRNQLQEWILSDKLNPRVVTRAKILFLVNIGEGGPGLTDASVAHELNVHRLTIHGLRLRFVQYGLEDAVLGQSRRPKTHSVAEQNHVMESDDWITVKSASQMFGFFPESVRRLLRNGVLKKSIRQGGKAYLSKSEFEAYVDRIRLSAWARAH